ncbi:MAG: hypothetical protein QXI33_00760 [Candidatus Pacearchaeota archaeon]
MVTEKKKFLPVRIPLLNKEVELYAHDNSELLGRTIKLDLTSILKGKALEILFSVKEENKQIIAIPVQAHLPGFYIRRMMRKGIDYVEDSFLTQCKDHRIRIKPFLLTRKRVSRRVLNGLRNKTKEELIEYSKDRSFENLILDIMNNKLQRELNPKLRKVYPLGLFEIKFIGIEDPKEHEIYEKEQEKNIEKKESENKDEQKKPKKSKNKKSEDK